MVGGLLGAMRREKRGGVLGAVLMATTAMAVIPATPAAAQTASAQRSFDIPAQSLPQALMIFGRQAGLQVTAEGAVTSGKASAAVNGDLAPAEALSRLLTGTGLTFRFVGSNGVQIEPVPQSADGAIQLGPVRVEGERAGGSHSSLAQAMTLPPLYSGSQVARGSRLGLLGNRDIMDTPFNTTSYTAQLIEDQQARTLTQVFANDSSIRMQQGGDAFSYDSYIRGFPVEGLDVLLNGLPGLAPDSLGLVQSAERVEVLKGPSAALGTMARNGGVGGTVNIVTKQAQDEPLTRLALGYASDSQFSGHIDIGRRFGDGGTFGIRANGYLLNGDGVRDGNKQRTGLGSLALDYKDSKTTLAVDLIYQDSKIDGAGRYVNFLGQVLDPPSNKTNIFVGSRPKNKTTTVIIRGERFLSDDISIFGEYGIHWLDTDFPTIGTADRVNENGDFLANITYLRTKGRNQSANGGIRTVITTGPINHNIVVSANVYNVHRGNSYMFGEFIPSNIYDPSPAPWPIRPGVPIITNKTTLSGVTFSDTISLFEDNLQLNLGVRQQWVKINSFSAATGDLTSHYNKQATTPIATILVKSSQSLSIYANYIQGLSSGTIAPPTASNAGEVLPPYKSKQYEIGAKWDMGAFATTISLFQISKPSAGLDPDSKRFSSNGERRNRGIEWNIFGSPTSSLKLLGGVTYTEGRITKAIDRTLVGNTSTGVPEFQVNISGEWEAPSLPGLAVNGRLVYTSSQYVNAANTQKIPNWTRVDLGVRYKINTSEIPITLRGNVENIFNKSYWESVYMYENYTSANAPRTFLISATIDF
jgi:iron complex outermembrane receptor protein